MKSKIGLFCSVRPENVIGAYDCESIYEVPMMLFNEKFDERVVQRLRLPPGSPDLKGWQRIVGVLKNPSREVSIGVVGKYVDLKESYKSLGEAIVHGGIANNTKVLSDVDGILVPGGFGERGAEGKMIAIRHAREKKIPYFGICFGMQLAAIEFARHVCGFKDATSGEFSAAGDQKKSRNLVIDFMNEQRGIHDKGGTMRLGVYPCTLSSGSKARTIYGAELIQERHRHRYEFNNKFRSIFEKNGMVLSGICETRDLVEIIELPNHPWFVGVQFHPEFKSRPLRPHPLFQSFVEAATKYQKVTKQQASKADKATTTRNSTEMRAQKN